MAGSQAPAMIEVRALHEQEELAEAVRLQQEVWGFDEVDLLPVRLFVVASHIGGQVLGAFDHGQMAGFSLAIPGLKSGGKPYLHGHMLGVREAYRNSGVGRALKLAQREEALRQGIELIEWTFDPLELKNAYFNIERLGTVIRRYVYNQYGMTSSRLHGGLPTDRCVAEWYLTSARTKAVLAGQPAPHGRIEARIAIPTSIGRLRQEDAGAARAIQQRVGEEFARHFGVGLVVTGFERSEETGTYLLGSSV